MGDKSAQEAEKNCVIRSFIICTAYHMLFVQ
jgi:hypothetical protein